jgi:Transglycosylase-like domain
VRIRIALTTALAVIAGLTTGIFTLGARQAASAQGTSGRADTVHATLRTSAMAGFAMPLSLPVVSTTTTPPPTPTTTTTTSPPAPAVKPAIVTAPKTTTPTVAPAATTTTPPAAAPAVAAPAVAAPVTDATSVATADWSCIRMRESGDRYNSAAAPSGAYGILISTWRSFGLSGWPYQAPASVQDQIALELYARYGFHPWSSRYACGL